MEDSIIFNPLELISANADPIPDRTGNLIDIVDFEEESEE